MDDHMDSTQPRNPIWLWIGDASGEKHTNKQQLQLASIVWKKLLYSPTIKLSLRFILATEMYVR